MHRKCIGPFIQLSIVVVPTQNINHSKHCNSTFGRFNDFMNMKVLAAEYLGLVQYVCVNTAIEKPDTDFNWMTQTNTRAT